ncbi:SAM hydrolase/SAM-dependent halogenase family protein [Herpetosiphon giganteus]|uniref:SAM hydrolase/SAM-dependent halogenase family protein n=1 Tax=Herpetosiphon giganteus TaxID=2029754 RepID=UPI001959A7FF|nr:SAM-dependent chlorinase/fluorinase [Herpetosiphon giganteus]MBM7846431.1 S-adenosylmethionine hydrolase [Herpetosiphon giganteus]
MQPNGILTLTTDFGSVDAYSAVLKGVILSVNPQATLIDVTHEIDAQRIAQAAYLLHTGYRYFPDGTVHLVIVDPGVGGDRKAVALCSPRWAFVAPDNGVLSYVWKDLVAEFGREQLQLIELSDKRWWLPKVSATFHGRDIFAPVAAHLSKGLKAEELGNPLAELVELPLAEPRHRLDDAWEGRIIHVDNFGNCITNITRDFIAQHGSIEQVEIGILDQQIGRICRTYADSEWGMVMALFGSSERLELAVRNGNAARMLGVGIGDSLRIRFIEG